MYAVETMHTVYSYPGRMSDVSLQSTAPAPDTVNIHDLVAAHLNNVECKDKDVEAVVCKHVSNARAHHATVRILADCLSTVQSGKLSVGRVLKCISMCFSSDTPPPVFLVEFKERVLQKWAAEIVHKLRSTGGRPWDVHKRSLLATSLGNMLEHGLCHTQHVTLVDQGRNPSWLADYIRCICLIWKENAGSVTPATIQYLRKLSCCTSECVVLISEYAYMCLDGSKPVQLFRELSRVQRIVFSSCGSTGVSNAAADMCIRHIKIEATVFEWLEKVESILLSTWDKITNPSREDGSCLVLPGLKGSHADEFEIPASVASSGSPLTVINCICSSVPLSKIDATIDHEVCMAYCSYAKKLPAALVAHLDTMLSVTCFGGEEACNPQWWKTYLDITMRIEGDVCARLGVSPHRSPSASSSSMHTVPSTDAACEMAVERASMSKSSVRKVQIAGNAFDVAHSEASKSSPYSVSLKRLSRVWDPPSNAFKDDLSVGGRFLSDFARIVTDRGLSTAIRVNLCDKTINYTTKDAALKAMRILVEYMTEYNKSRRMRKNTSVLKVNSKPEVDSRRGAKRSRAASPAPPTRVET
tara:strand:- start:2985 stop:4736 length:1752 start_codon:yes stop_codon:yes gene_type:complete